ncbi:MULTISPECIES: class I SAM-dependent methyltransferase [Sphingobium]|jgi:S-adenosylmethionine-diacylgycerolhomoserine-N-methlytransferase|uniref:class I SAM-dependent methyltransferase n=1 Tax=Sphingobium TaxID=165695 RepID=UPI000DBB3CB9|nr:MULTISPECIES: class I SAM-dependent methyltransferase [Sphingobium]KAA9018449.1 class I SAM-dependent methyltransferase [Sphingobium limneticum]MBU0933909.1 class I SAM-dependent methyltransferase [Alphaproteobacteria bacterium]BBC99817.1 S-adenosylmethionine-diacylgycerolhomoserine-N-methlytransferase [Sphingobium sp. YG1]
MSGHSQLMDGVYRYQRHFYDLTRKYYLLGRDGLIADLDVPAGGAVLEIGCGTGRNLIAVGKAWPQARLCGVDISEAMLDTARASVAKTGMGDRVMLAQGDACGFDAQALFGRATFERVFISYALSMIPEWEMALAQAARCVAPGGKLEIVDFGQQEALPALWKRALFGWLGKFHVSPRRELAPAIERLAQDMGGFPHSRTLYRGYAVRGGLIRV